MHVYFAAAGGSTSAPALDGPTLDGSGDLLHGPLARRIVGPIAKELAAKGEIMLSAGKAEDELVY